MPFRFFTVGAVSLLFTTLVLAQASSGVVQRVVDGDTLVVSGVGTVRLIGVNSPQIADPQKPIQSFGTEATTFIREIADGQAVELKFEGSRRDRYNRTRAYVYLPDGTMLNAELIHKGYAYVNTQSPFSKMEEFRALQRDAMTHSRGLWRQPQSPD